VHVVCNDDPSCVQAQAPAVIQHIATNLGAILSQLRTAASTTETIVVGLYNPLFTISGSDALVENNVNPTLAGVAAQYGARFADPFPIINGNASPRRCVRTRRSAHRCTTFTRPTPGYQVIADVILAASGYH
jgi:hypothetical protein